MEVYTVILVCLHSFTICLEYLQGLGTLQMAHLCEEMHNISYIYIYIGA